MKKITEYQTIIVDLDGTLYYQLPVRKAMLIEMLLHFWRFRDYLIVKKYRTYFEQGLNEKERLDRLSDNAPSVIQEWMIRRPCPYVAKFRDKDLICLLNTAKENGVTIIVYSDYPVKEKLAAMNFVPDMAYCSEDTGSLKPEADGLKRILRKNDVNCEHCLVIGDREEKDGALAVNLGSDVLILPKDATARDKIYRNIGI